MSAEIRLVKLSGLAPSTNILKLTISHFQAPKILLANICFDNALR